MERLVDHSGRPIPAERDVPLNSCTGTVVLPQYIQLGGRPFIECHSIIQDILQAQGLETISVSCYVRQPYGRRRFPLNTAKIVFNGRDLPAHVFIGGLKLSVQAFRPVPRQCRSCWRFGHPEKYCRSHPCCPLCAQTGHTRDDCSSTKKACANCGGDHSVLYRGCPVYRFEAEVAQIRVTHGLTLREARQEATN